MREDQPVQSLVHSMVDRKVVDVEGGDGCGRAEHRRQNDVSMRRPVTADCGAERLTESDGREGSIYFAGWPGAWGLLFATLLRSLDCVAFDIIVFGKFRRLVLRYLMDLMTSMTGYFANETQ